MRWISVVGSPLSSGESSADPTRRGVGAIGRAFHVPGGGHPGRRRRVWMCGIIGYVGPREAKPLLLQGLERLEYRGYDSAGLALREDDGLDYVRAVGPLGKLKEAAGPNRAGPSHRPRPTR